MIAYGSKVEVLPKSSGTHNAEPGSLPVSAGNPFILEGEKTTGFEILHDLDWVQPDAIILPVGTGGHLTMMWRSLLQMRQAGLIEELACRLIGVQIQSPTSVVGDRRSRRRLEVSREPLTELEESEPIFKNAAINSIRNSGGLGIEVSAKEVIQGMSILARTEGIFAEPAAASVVASLKPAKDRGLLRPRDRIICVVTGAGLKDTRTIRKIARAPAPIIATEDFMIRPVDIGTTKLRMMGALANGPAFGYMLWKTLSKEKRITTASVYQHLSELEAAALVRRSRVVRFRGRERMFYELTRKGSELLKALKSNSP